jgi:hypothetical protein
MATVTQKPTDISRMNIGEVFEHISSLTPAKRGPEIQRICKIAPEIKLILQLTFNQSYEFDLPKGKPPFEPLNIPENFGYKRLGREIRKFRYFMKTLTPNMKRIKRESIFIEMLESVPAQEADVLVMIKDKKLKYKGITRKVLMDNIPEIFDGEELGKSNG